jgi:DNA damage-binding protein 1
MARDNEKTSLLEASTTTPSSSLQANGDVETSARLAYECENANASRLFHETKAAAGSSREHDEEPWHQSAGGLLQPVIFGGLDGILTSFAIVAGAAGGGLSVEAVLVLGFSNIFADALR